MKSNYLLAFVLSAAFLFFWSIFVVPRFTPPPAPVTRSAVATISTPVQTLAIPSGGKASSGSPAETLFEDSQNAIVFSSRGAGVKHWRLKLKGPPVDLVEFPDAETLPLSTSPETDFRGTVQGRQIQWQGRLPRGLLLTKTLQLSEKGFLHDFILRFDNPTGQPVEVNNFDWGWGPGLGTTENERKENARNLRALSMGKLNAQSLKPGEVPAMGSWAGVDNRYFLVAFLPPSDHRPPLVVTGAKDQVQLQLRETVTVPAHGQTVLHYQLYAGPKGYTQLGTYKKGLEESINFGVFTFLGKAVLKAVYRLQRMTGNYGWAIVFLTVLLQILMLPLTLKSFKAMSAMKVLQPQIAQLQTLYKNDPKRLNVEMMNLYKKTGTNPFGGCLPMVLQMPIFWALFTTLRNAYELRGAPFVGWIHDLSSHDPYYVLPVVMGGAMFLQQRMSGATTDPTQKQMMLMMPVIFTVMFLNFPAGLVLYWLTNNVMTMALQWAFKTHSERTK